MRKGILLIIVCLIGIGFMIGYGLISVLDEMSWYSGTCLVVSWETISVGKDRFRGSWCVDYQSDSDHPLIKNDPSAVGDLMDTFNQSEPFCIPSHQNSIQKSDRGPKYDQLMNQHPINSSSRCYLRKPYSSVGDSDDIFYASKIRWESTFQSKDCLIGITLLSVSCYLIILLMAIGIRWICRRSKANQIRIRRGDHRHGNRPLDTV